MSATSVYLDSYEIDLLKDLLEHIPAAVHVRGRTYYEANNVLHVTRKGDTLEARILGSSSNIYNAWINLGEMDYFCDCLAALPCKHIASLVIWGLGLSELNLEDSLSHFKNEPECELLCMLNEEGDRISLYAKNSKSDLIPLKEVDQYSILKSKWQNSLGFFLNKHKDRLYALSDKEDFPLYELVEHFHLLEKKGKPAPEYREKERRLHFGGFLEFDAIVYDMHVSGNFGPDTEYDLILYYFDPLHKVYREIEATKPLADYKFPFGLPDHERNYFFHKGISPIRVNHALILSETPLSEREKKLQNLIAAETSSIEQKAKEEIEGQKKKHPDENFFYLLRGKERVLEKLDFLDYRLTCGEKINSLYRDFNKLSPFIPQDLKEHINQAYKAGPALAISMYVDEREEKPKIKGKVEIIYAQENRYLKAQYWKKKNKELLTNLVFGFPPAKILNYQSNTPATLLQYSINHQLIKRNLKKERDLLDKKKIPFAHRKTNGEFTFTSRFLKRFAQHYLPILKKQSVVMRLHQSLWPFIEELTYKVKFEIENSSGMNWFQGELKIEGVSEKDQTAILAAYRKKEELLKLSNGSWVLTSAFNLDTIHKTLEEIGINLSQKGKSRRLSKGQLLALSTDEQFLALRAEKKITDLCQSFQEALQKRKEIDLDIGPALEKTIRPYQREGVSFLHSLFQLKVGGILADDMGLGKTLQTLAFIENLQRKAGGSVFLVVGPLSALSVWQEECLKFTPHISTQVWHGSKLKKEDFLDDGIIITTYTTLTQNIEKFAKLNFSSVFLDEAQNIKNISTENAKAVRQLNSSSFFCLTGTPIENRLGELWALMELCFPGLLGSKKHFKNLHGLGQDIAMRDRLLKRIAPFVLRRRKQDVLKELPEKIETLIKLELHKTQALVYEQVRKEALIALANAGPQYLMIMLPYLMRLRRICCHPDLKNKHLPDISLSSKFSYLRDNLEKIADSSSGTLIFSQFTDVLDMIAALLEREKYEFFYISGRTSASKRQKMVKNFQAGQRDFFLISLKSGGTALTLHRANTVIHLDPWWNPASEDQATDRAHRIGQNRKVSVYKLISKNSVEEKVLRLQGRKKRLFNSIFNDSLIDSDKAPISRGDLSAILEDAVF